MVDGLTIQEAARHSGLTAHTLRYYERVGLLDPVRRAGNGHRRFGRSDLERLLFLTRLRATGMPIRLIRRYVELAREGEHTMPERRALLQTQRDAVAEHIDELRDDLDLLDGKIAMYATRESTP